MRDTRLAGSGYDRDGNGVDNITFVNDDPNGPSTDQYVQSELAEMVENVVATTGHDININSVGRAQSLGTDSNHNPGKANAVDINQVNGQPVDQARQGAASIGEVQDIQDGFAAEQNIRENFGPTRNDKTSVGGTVVDMTSSVGATHKNHILISSQACHRAGTSCVKK